MSKFDYKNIMPRFNLLAILMSLVAVAVVAKTSYVMTAKREFWNQVADRVKKDSVSVKPRRGNILSCNGEVLSSSLPEFKIFMDFKAMKEAKKDTLWLESIDSVCSALHYIFPDVSAGEFKDNLEKGREKMSRHWPILRRRIDYDTYCQVKSIPFLSMSPYVSGFHGEEFNARRHAYGSAASRTIGGMYGGKDSARYGLELTYDSILRGTTGYINRRKVLNSFLDIMVKEPVDGCDIITTLDMSMQDIAERTVVDELKEVNGNVGVAIVMEVATGDVKAIVNMERCSDGEYREINSHAVSDLLEPGSVFKTASLLVALDDGVANPHTIVETGSGIWPMYGRQMKDHNWHRGGYGTIDLTKSLMVSSNIGVSRIIDEHYKSHPEKFVEGIYRLGLADDLEIPIPGATPAKIRMPKKDKTGRHYANWYKTTLPWMSIGYETQVPPISTLTFYNTIANNGRMVKPRFVKCVMKDGQVVKEYPVTVMRPQIAKPQSIAQIQEMLEKVVSEGLGKKAGSHSFKVAGKTGTAQMASGASGYNKSGTMNYLLSFVGYFPADKPRYSCIVCIQKSGLPASSGFSAHVFHNISEGIMAKDLKLRVSDACDSLSDPIPMVKNGNVAAASYVLSQLGVENTTDWKGKPMTVWGSGTTEDGKRVMLTKNANMADKRVPNVVGMGARDAVYLMESRGVKTRLQGRGRVVRQTISAGQQIEKNQTCTLVLE